MKNINEKNIELVLYFARLWGRTEEKAILEKDTKMYNVLESYEMDDILYILPRWVDEFLNHLKDYQDADIDDWFNQKMTNLKDNFVEKNQEPEENESYTATKKEIKEIAREIRYELSGDEVINDPCCNSGYYTLKSETIDGHSINLAINVTKDQDDNDNHLYKNNKPYFSIYSIVDDLNACKNISEPVYIYTENTTLKALEREIQKLVENVDLKEEWDKYKKENNL